MYNQLTIQPWQHLFTMVNKLWNDKYKLLKEIGKQKYWRIAQNVVL